MARKPRPPAWVLTVKHSVRQLFFRYLEVFRPKDRNESKAHAYVMDIWEGEDDLSKPTPALDSSLVQVVAEVIQKFGVNEKVLASLAEDLKRVQPEDGEMTMELAREDIEFLLTVYDRVVGDAEAAKQAPNLTRGIVTRQLVDYIEAFEAAVSKDSEATEGILVPLKKEDKPALPAPVALPAPSEAAS